MGFVSLKMKNEKFNRCHIRAVLRQIKSIYIVTWNASVI